MRRRPNSQVSSEPTTVQNMSTTASQHSTSPSTLIVSELNEKNQLDLLEKGKREELVERIQSKNPDLLSVFEKNFAEVESEGDDGTLYIRSSKLDPESPRNWPKWKKYGIVILASWLNNLVTIGVSSYSTGTTLMDAQFGVSAEVGTVGLSTFIMGFAIGPLLLAPLSEFFGRRPVYLISFGIFVLLQFATAFGNNIAVILVFRFLQGFFGSAPLSNTGGVVHDLFTRDTSGMAVAIYALSSTDGPPFGLVSYAYVAQTLGWRWISYLNLIIFGFFWVVIFFFLPETRDTVIMMKKAKKIREETGNENIFALHEQDRSTPGRLWKVSLIRPFKFLFTEPITYLSAIINGFLYGVIFLANQAFPLIFGVGAGGYGWTSPGAVNLTYLSFVVGAFIGFGLQPLQDLYYKKQLALNGGKSNPETRWYTSIYLVWLLPIGLIIAAWTSLPHVVFIAPLIGFTLFGIGFFATIQAILNYVVDSYGHYAASSLAGVVMVRNVVGAIFPLFSDQMYQKLGNQWATTLLAGMALLLVPIPYFLFYKGRVVRYKSPYCREHFDEDS